MGVATKLERGKSKRANV